MYKRQVNCGAINIDGCRITFQTDGKRKETKRTPREDKGVWTDKNSGMKKEKSVYADADPKGRFPANFVYDEKVKDTLDQQGGWRKTGAMSSMPSSKSSIFPIKHIQISYSEASEGFVSRYFKGVK